MRAFEPTTARTHGARPVRAAQRAFGGARRRTFSVALALSAGSAQGALSACRSAEPPAPAAREAPSVAPSPPPPSASASAQRVSPEDAGPPAALACLARLYVGTPARRGGGWVLELPGGRALPWDDGRAKSLDRKLDDADLEDTLSIPYRAGPIAPPGVDEDAGRVRVSALFEATYGGSAEAVRKSLVATKLLGKTLWVHARAAPAFAAVAARLERALAKDARLAVYFEGMGGTFNWRPIAGTNRPSAHSFGVSLDLNPARSAYFRNDGPRPRWRNEIPQAIVDAFEAERFIWGGRWAHYDTMHFEWRPELFECRP